ncbi:MAG: hypothetical protein ABDH66_08390 [Bacteroidia bacterium]
MFRAFSALSVSLGFVGGWILGDQYYTEMRRMGRWILRGEGPLWDSAWVMRHIQGVKTPSPSQWIWAISEALRKEQAFQSVHFYYTGKGEGRIYARACVPVARIKLPVRQYYIDTAGKRLPFVRPLDLPIVEALRWDSVAFAYILTFLQEKPLYRKLISRIYQEVDGTWHMHSEFGSETYVLGRTAHLPVGIYQLDVYLQSLQPKLGGHTCKRVILYIPSQIICQ